MPNLDSGQKFGLILTLILIVLCIVLGIASCIHERQSLGRVSHSPWGGNVVTLGRTEPKVAAWLEQQNQQVRLTR